MQDIEQPAKGRTPGKLMKYGMWACCAVMRLLVAGKETDTLAAVDIGTGRITKATLAPAPYHLTTPGAGRVR